MSEDQHIPIYDAQEPSEESKQLVALFHDLESRQLDFLDDAAKSVVERVATFLAILFGVTAFGSVFPPPISRTTQPRRLLSSSRSYSTSWRWARACGPFNRA